MTNSQGTAPTAAPLRERLRASALLPGLLLALFALVSALLLAVSSELTAAAIAQRKAEDLQASLSQVLPHALYDNDPVKTILTLDDTLEGPVAVHRARQGEAVSAVAFSLIGQGYAGGITVLMGIAPDGRVLGVRVLSHAETPGLGDKIEAAKSDWILSFDGRSLSDPGLEGWRVKRDGGDFDQFSGATITPRAVVATVHRGLSLFDRHRAALLAPPPKEHD